MSIHTTEQQLLQVHILAENAHSVSLGYQVSVVSDPAHWARYDIFNVEQYEHYMATEYYMDIYREFNGIKPRWIDFSKLSTAEINEMIIQETKGYEQEQVTEEQEAAAYQKKQDEQNAYVPNNVFAELLKEAK